MHIKSIAVGVVFGLIAGVGSVSADELSVADTAGETTTQSGFAAVAQLPVTALSSAEMAETRGSGNPPTILLGTIEIPAIPPRWILRSLTRL